MTVASPNVTTIVKSVKIVSLIPVPFTRVIPPIAMRASKRPRLLGVRSGVSRSAAGLGRRRHRRSPPGLGLVLRRSVGALAL